MNTKPQSRSNQADGTPSALDLLSTSQKVSCIYHAPFIALCTEAGGKIVQACCNHWDCPKCGIVRAKHEYGRIVNGAKLLGKRGVLYFYTFTCRGKDLPLLDAENNYLLWTNRLLSTMRSRCNKEGGVWTYVQVTERQKRGHPHSHLLMAWLPSDAVKKLDAKGKPYLYSKWFHMAHERSGLGTQSKITQAENIEATAKYIAKYLFKEAQFAEMPKHWKRVRYSQNFPKTETKENEFVTESFPIITRFDWKRVNETGLWFVCEDDDIYAIASHRIHRAVKPN